MPMEQHILVCLEAIPFDQILIKLTPLSMVFLRMKEDSWSSAKFTITGPNPRSLRYLKLNSRGIREVT